jgi:fused signal recognition particle receptor
VKLLRRAEKTQTGLEPSRRSWFAPLARLLQRERLDGAAWEEAEELLLSADVGVSTTRALLDRVRQRLQDGASPGAGTGAGPLGLLKEEMRAILAAPMPAGDPFSLEGASRPLVLLVIGVNGVGKTTSIAKLAALLREEGRAVVLGAADSFRAAAIEQLQAWGQRAGATVIAHRMGADPGAVAYDAYQAALARGADVLIIDTAGRLHTKLNLMEEMKKVQRVISRLEATAPHQTLLVLDATVGQNGLIQARAFTEAVGCTGIILAKLDGTARGGIVLTICDQLHLPVLFVGTGEGLEDLVPFDPEAFVQALFMTDPKGRAGPSPSPPTDLGEQM